MTDGVAAGRTDEAFFRARSGDADAFAEWMALVEIPLRRSLSRFSRAVDVEVVVQETFLRMWLVARDPQRVLTGGDAAFKFAFRVARNVALEEMRRNRRDCQVELSDLESLPEGHLAPALPDPMLARAIAACLAALPRQPKSALSARLHQGNRPDRELAAALQMKINTFLQNIVRARRLLRSCLQGRGVDIKEIPS